MKLDCVPQPVCGTGVVPTGVGCQLPYQPMNAHCPAQSTKQHGFATLLGLSGKGLCETACYFKAIRWLLSFATGYYGVGLANCELQDECSIDQVEVAQRNDHRGSVGVRTHPQLRLPLALSLETWVVATSQRPEHIIFTFIEMRESRLRCSKI
jgi:hypothetical protein